MTTKRKRREPESLGEVLRTAREAIKPKPPSYDRLTKVLLVNYAVDVSAEALRQYHRGVMGAQRPDMMIVAALLDIYGLEVADLPADLQDQALRLRDVLNKASRGTPPGTRTRNLQIKSLML